MLSPEDKDWIDLKIKLAVEMSSHQALATAEQIMRDVIDAHKKNCNALTTWSQWQRVKWRIIGGISFALMMALASVVIAAVRYGR